MTRMDCLSTFVIVHTWFTCKLRGLGFASCTPATPKDLSSKAASSTSVDLSWKAPTNCQVVSYYSINVWDMTGPQPKGVGSSGSRKSSKLTYTVGGLTPGHKYKFVVIAVGGANSGQENAGAAAVTYTTTPNQFISVGGRRL